MGLFSDVERMGLGGVDMNNVFNEGKKQTSASPSELEQPKETEKKEEDVLFDKSYQCPICDNNFKVKAIRTGKVKLVDQDEELRPIYESHIDPLKYDAVTCPRCGYSALTRYYKPVTTAQLRTIRQEFCANFKGIPEEDGCMSYRGALLRHKLSLICAVKRNAKNSEKAYIFLKMAWLMRGYLEELPADDATREELIQEENECIQKAYEGFQAAFSKETFPMCGMDEMSLRYTMAVLAHKLGKMEDAVRLLAGVLGSKTASARIKDKALVLKDTIKNEVMANK
ncbi:MAG: DUF2225 domain-containing protein [Lachnospiraceae bacterium]|nr:DUF2225 domain-containing protein [Lachnospiraceae bacterium]MBP3505479.1 DUF2225 domain-containing protein [Lachnospiraceae bacterium]